MMPKIVGAMGRSAATTDIKPEATEPMIVKIVGSHPIKMLTMSTTCGTIAEMAKPIAPMATPRPAQSMLWTPSRSVRINSSSPAKAVGLASAVAKPKTMSPKTWDRPYSRVPMVVIVAPNR